MKMNELRQKSEEELRRMLEEHRKQAEKTASLLIQKKVKNVKERGFLKKDIARILTILHNISRQKP